MIEDTPSYWHRLTEPSILLGLLTFLTLVATWLRTSMTDRRNRRWAALDRAREAAEEEEKKDDRRRIAREQRERDKVTHKKIDQNTEISRAAFREANTVNQKIASYGSALVAGQIEQTEELKERMDNPPVEPVPEGPPDAPDSPPRDYGDVQKLRRGDE